MQIRFSKYQGTGNDFVIIDQMSEAVTFNRDMIAFLCDRKFGIGADGVMLLRPDKESDFRMVYYNSDGNESSMCGNGGRCLVHFAYHNGYIKHNTKFMAIDGLHDAVVLENNIISLRMADVSAVENFQNAFILNTGSPHYVTFTLDPEKADIVKEGRTVRYSDRFKQEGINVNLAKVTADDIYVRTYERGVEDETLSCGTGVTATAIAAHHAGLLSVNDIGIKTKGGDLRITFNIKNDIYTEVNLIGPAICVFNGEIKL